MKNIRVLNTVILFLIGFNLMAAEKVNISVSEQDAKIYVDGILTGTGTVKISVLKNQCVNVKVEKVGFITIEKNYCNKKGAPEPPEKDFFKLDIDDAYSSSISTDVANVDISIKSDISNENAWKTINQIIVSYFDVIELSDKETSYLRTAWSVQSFKSSVIRTRFLVKGGSGGFRIKLVSEISKDTKATVKNDESFKEWDRILRKFENLVSEIQSRLK